MSGARGGFSPRCNTYNHNHNKAKKAKYEAKVSGRALWVPWPNPVHNSRHSHQSKPCQILWMVLGREQQQAAGRERRAAAAGQVRAQPPLIANPPSQPLIIPSHVANALLLTR